MRLAGNFNPEWGYLAPAPTLVRTVRIAVVAAVVGATAGAAVVFSLVERPAAEESVAARTLVQTVASVSLPVSASPTHAETPGLAASESSTRSTTQHPTSISSLAESPAVAGPPPVQSPPQAGNEAAAVPDGALVQRKPVKKVHVTPRYYDQASRGPLALLPSSYGARPQGADYYGQRGEY